MLLPIVTFAVGETAYILRTTKGAMEEVTGQTVHHVSAGQGRATASR
ncbi:MAG: hypothetical protein WKF82_06230 [Nocardioidaceae bacterium]